ncbi:MAG TPA: hypothetical protein VM389_11390 [Phycisphaerae bacterium]|nr:hypothetical protein [Phycisphaerae bacterium]
MPEDVPSLLDRVCELIGRRIDPARVARAKRRQAAAMAWQDGEYLPLRFPCPVPEAGDLPEFNWRQQFHDPAKSLYMQLKNDVLPAVASDGDNVPGVRADTGVVNCMSVLGARYVVPEHTKPVVNEYVPKETLAEFELPADIRGEGVMPRMVEHMEHHKAALAERGLGEAIGVYHCDQQGPFDIAAQTRGHEIFTDLYEDPDFVHALMGKTTAVYVAVSKLCKEINGDPPDGGNVSGVWMENGGVRMCGDSDILIGPQQFEQFVLPYQEEALAAFGGGWLHYCGGVKGFSRAEGLHLHELYARNRHLRGLNWTTAGDWIGEMRKLRELHVVHVGTVPRGDGESLADYFRKALSPYEDRCGLLLEAEIRAPEADSAMAKWRRVQDEKFG